MRRMRISVVMVAVALCAGAATARSGSGVRPWLAGSGSWNAYSMEDVNQVDIAGLNDLFASSRFFEGLSMDEIKSGVGLGVAAGMEVGAVGFGLGYERLGAATKSAVDLGVLLYYEPPATFDYKIPANAYRALVEFRLPTSGPMAARLGVAGGIVSLSGSVSVSTSGMGIASVGYEGKGPLLETYASGEWWAAPRLALGASLGYRHADVNEPKIDGTKATGFSIDYSGVFVRAGVKLALAK